MEERKPSELTDQELLKESKKRKTAAVVNAFLIGFLIGIVLYSVIMSTFGFLMLIPLFLAYKLINKSKYDKNEIEDILKARNLK